MSLFCSAYLQFLQPRGNDTGRVQLISDKPPTPLDRGSTSTQASAIIRGAAKFLKKFDQIIRRSALSTYKSALPLTPSNTLLHQNFHRTIPGAPSIMSSLRDFLRNDQIIWCVLTLV
jgi:hypothetical protein